MSYIKLDKKAFFHNIDYYAHLVGGIDKISIVLKDNAYGHGLEQIGLMATQFGIKHCVVRNLNEADKLLPYNFDTILILYDKATKQTYPSNYIFVVNSIDDLKNLPNNIKIELKCDSGMSRNGIQLNQIDEVLRLIKSKKLNLYGIFTHFCCADDIDDKLKLQETKFTQFVNQIKSSLPYSFRIHCANSAAAHKIDNSKYDIARIGIGLYGYCKMATKNLKPVLSLWSDKISTRILNKGDQIGYGATFEIKHNNTVVSNYDIGYGDGMFRINENHLFVLPNSKQILGRMSMDSFSIMGDENCVCVFDDANYVANIHNTIPYEILTHLSNNIKRRLNEKDFIRIDFSD